MRKTLNVIYVATFFLALIIPICHMNTGKDVVSAFDNRVLVEYPLVGQVDYEEKVELYLRDRIGFRDQFVTGYQRINDVLAGELTHPLYTYGRDGYMFFNMHYNVQYSGYHDLFVASVVKMKEYCDARGVPFYFMFEPEKIAVYRQYLPDGVNYTDEWVDQLLSKLREQGVIVVDNREMLTRISAREQVFNRQYDAGHWNDLGAFYATNNLWATVKKDFPDVTLYSPEDFEIKTTIAEYLPSSKFSVNEEVPSYKVKTEYTDLTQKYAALKHDSRYPFFRYYKNTAENAGVYPKMLVFHGSYYNRSPEFFIGRASEYIGVHDYQNVLNLDYYFSLFQPDLVVFEVAEYTFDDRYFDSRAMAAINFNPGIQEVARGELDLSMTGVPNEENAYIIMRNDFDELYYEGDLSDARRVYLIYNGKTFDLHQNANKLYYVEVVNGLVNPGDAIIAFEDYDGKLNYLRVQLEEPTHLDKSESICFPGTSYDGQTGQVLFLAGEEGNAFNSVNIQLLDGASAEFLDTVDTMKEKGLREGTYIHRRKTGWYRVRLKANGSVADKYFDHMFYLEKGRCYRYIYNVTVLTADKIEVYQYDLYGGCSLPAQTTELMQDVQHTEGVSQSGDTWIFTSAVPGNNFDSFVLNLLEVESGNQIGPIAIALEAAPYKGEYLHTADSGTYYIKLRGNTNLADEYIIVSVQLTQGMMYEWSFDVVDLTTDTGSVKNITFHAKGKRE